MKLKAIALALFVAGAGASYALADEGHGRGNDATTTSASVSSTTTEMHGKGHGKAGSCRPMVSYVLNGTFVSADASSLTMNVTHANHHAKRLGSPVTVGVDDKTRIRRNGKAVTLADLQAGDRLNVQARGCKDPQAGAAPVTLVAKRVVAHPAKQKQGDDGEKTTTESTTTTQSETTGTTTVSNG